MIKEDLPRPYYMHKDVRCYTVWHIRMPNNQRALDLRGVHLGMRRTPWAALQEYNMDNSLRFKRFNTVTEAIQALQEVPRQFIFWTTQTNVRAMHQEFYDSLLPCRLPQLPPSMPTYSVTFAQDLPRETWGEVFLRDDQDLLPGLPPNPHGGTAPPTNLMQQPRPPQTYHQANPLEVSLRPRHPGGSQQPAPQDLSTAHVEPASSGPRTTPSEPGSPEYSQEELAEMHLAWLEVVGEEYYHAMSDC
jgi:hypothetical protein